MLLQPRPLHKAAEGVMIQTHVVVDAAATPLVAVDSFTTWPIIT
jgi:hypothetical protein